MCSRLKANDMQRQPGTSKDTCLREIERRLMQLEISETSCRIAWRSVFYSLSQMLMAKDVIRKDDWNSLLRSMMDMHRSEAAATDNPSVRNALLAIAAEIEGFSVGVAPAPTLQILKGGKHQGLPRA